VTLAYVDAWVCPFCKGPQETLSHIFLDCDLARILWRASPWPHNTAVFSSRPISDWILAIIYPIDWPAIPKDEVRSFQLFAARTLDHIWFSRNKLVHEALHPVPTKVIKLIYFSLNLHLSAWQDAALSSLWVPLKPSCLKGNFDVAIKDTFAVAATTISDSSGNIVFAASQKLSNLDVLQGEATAAFLATRLAIFSGCDRF
jgi:hypothetical protein